MDLHIQWLEPWGPISQRALQSGNHIDELRREVGPTHPLYGASVTPVAARGDNDDVLFEVGGGPGGYAVVHLTWSGQQEGPPLPMTEFFLTVHDWVERGMKRDHAEWQSG